MICTLPEASARLKGNTGATVYFAFLNRIYPGILTASDCRYAFAVQRRTRRTNGSLMLLRFPCGGIVCNGLFDSLEADHRLQTQP